MLRGFIQLLLIILFLGAGVLLAKKFITSGKEPPKKERPPIALLVRTETMQKSDIQVTIHGYGTVRAKSTVKVVPQVSGQAVEVYPDFVAGGFFPANQTLIAIDPQDYELAVQRAEASVARAQVKLEQEQAEADVARKEWQLIQPGKEPESSLVFRGPQIRQAQAELKSAQAELATANLNLQRTKISLPYPGRVIEENVDIGQYLVTGQPVATVYGTDIVEIPVPLEDRELEWFALPLSASSSVENQPAIVDIYADFAGQRRHWTGRVVRTEGQIDPTSRMVSVIVEVKNPFTVENGGVPLTPGMFVEVEIRGRELAGVIPVPRHAVHNKNEVWVLNNDQLHIRPVEIARGDNKYYYVTSGLDDNTVIIISPIDTVTDGMLVRTELDILSNQNENVEPDTPKKE
jgi:RND family efflux transporter MFP subunit